MDSSGNVTGDVVSSGAGQQVVRDLRIEMLQTGHPAKLYELAAIPGSMALEKTFHLIFASKRKPIR